MMRRLLTRPLHAAVRATSGRTSWQWLWRRLHHEALIGLGTILGPGAGALAEKVGHGDPLWGVLAVSAVLATSIFACGIVAWTRGMKAPAR